MSQVNDGGNGALKETRMVTIHPEYIEIEGSPWYLVGKVGWEACVMVFFMCSLVKYENNNKTSGLLDPEKKTVSVM